VVTSWYEKAREFKSPIRVVSAFLLRSRETQLAINARLQEEMDELKSEREAAERQLQQKQQEIDAFKQQVRKLKKECQEAKRSVNLPSDPPLGRHGFGARMISLAVNVARAVGLRGAARVLKIFFRWLDIKQRTPSRNSIRNWLQRLGVAELKRPHPDSDDLVVMVDHSIQIGTEKVLVALGVNASAMPARGEALKHEDVRVLEVKPSSQWKTEDMQREYESLADRFGTPRAVLSDAATELQEGAKCLKKRRNDTIVLGDFKHFAANAMKSILGKDKRFQEVVGKMGSTRSATQQTELAHLAPPAPKQKARFMNLARIIRWMTMTVWLLKTPEAKARQEISDERIQEKLGWVAEYEDDIAVWQECQDVVSVSLTFINKHGLFKGASQEMHAEIGNSLKHDKSKELAERLIEFVSDGEQQLRDGERLPMSTEILESSFGLYKQLERQHSKSGFTSLLACFPALLKPTTPELVTEAFRRVSRKEVKAWVDQHFSSTVSSRRRSVYNEHKKATKGATAPAIAT